MKNFRVYIILKEIFRLIKNHRLYILAPLLIILALLTILVFVVGPGAIMAIIYAGI